MKESLTATLPLPSGSHLFHDHHSSGGAAPTPWLASLRQFEAMDARIIVPGQGPAQYDKTSLKLTADAFASIIDQVHAALERGVFRPEDVQAAVNVDAIGVQFTPGASAPSDGFKRWVSIVVRKVVQESLDGVIRGGT